MWRPFFANSREKSDASAFASPSRHISKALTTSVLFGGLWLLIGFGNTSSRLTERSLNQRPVDRMTVG
jgi:hypothetical protein